MVKVVLYDCPDPSLVLTLPEHWATIELILLFYPVFLQLPWTMSHLVILDKFRLSKSVWPRDAAALSKYLRQLHSAMWR